MCQQRGKDHIRFMTKVAEIIWAENDFKIPYAACLREAFRRHREKILRLDAELRKADPYYERNKAERIREAMKDTVKIPIPPKIGMSVKSAPAQIQSALND